MEPALTLDVTLHASRSESSACLARRSKICCSDAVLLHRRRCSYPSGLAAHPITSRPSLLASFHSPSSTRWLTGAAARGAGGSRPRQRQGGRPQRAAAALGPFDKWRQWWWMLAVEAAAAAVAVIALAGSGSDGGRRSCHSSDERRQRRWALPSWPQPRGQR